MWTQDNTRLKEDIKRVHGNLDDSQTVTCSIQPVWPFNLCCEQFMDGLKEHVKLETAHLYGVIRVYILKWLSATRVCRTTRASSK